MFAQQINMDNIANNISNVNTVGFKKTRATFEDLLYTTLPPARLTSQDATLQLGSGVRVLATVRDFRDGGLLPTDQPLDVALTGHGFLAVNTPEGRAYTRNGTLQVTDGYLTTTQGYRVLDDRGREIRVDERMTGVEIGENGLVLGSSGSSDEKRNLGQIGVAKITNQHAMQARGGSLYTIDDAHVRIGTPGTDQRARIVPGFLEMGNVQVVEEMVNLITAQRAYEVGSKAIQASDEMLAQANNLRR